MGGVVNPRLPHAPFVEAEWFEVRLALRYEQFCEADVS